MPYKYLDFFLNLLAIKVENILQSQHIKQCRFSAVLQQNNY